MSETRAKMWCLDLVDGHIYVLKNGSRLCIEGGPTSGQLYGGVTGARKAMNKDGKELIKFKFLHGSSRGFCIKAFDWQHTEFSKEFHVQGVTTVEDFLQCLANLCQSHSLQISLSPQSASLTQQSTSQSTLESDIVSPKPMTGSRKRKRADSTQPQKSLPPSLRPLMIVSQPATDTNCSENPEPDLDTDIQKCFVGYFELPVSVLIEPPRSRLLRKVDKVFVERLKDAMLENPPTDTAPIVALVNLGNGENFDETKSFMYDYETIGGNNSRQALQELNRECDNPTFRTRLVSVYKGLSDQQARRLAAKHNHATSLHHDMTTWDKVDFCRMLIFELSGISYSDTSEVPSKKPDNWRSKCSETLMQKVRALDDASIFFLAGLPTDVYALVERVFSLYSLCELKGQTSKRGSIGHRLDLKGNNLKPLRGLEMDVVKEVLTTVVEKKITLKEMTSHCNKTKQLSLVQKAFVEATGLDDWTDATDKLPTFTTTEALDEFTSVKSFSSTDRFQQYCRAALRSLEFPSEIMELGTYTHDNYSACMSNDHNQTFLSLKQHTSHSVDPFTGFSCTVIDYKCIESLDAVVRQVRAINTVGGTNSFSVVVMCEWHEIADIKGTFEKCGIPYHTIGYVHNTTPSSVVNSASVFLKQTSLLFVGTTERPSSRATTDDLFPSEGRVRLKDDSGVAAGEDDCSVEFYKELFRSLTKASDWIFLPQIQSVAGLLGAILSERNAVGIASATILPLAKREMVKELEKLKEVEEGSETEEH